MRWPEIRRLRLRGLLFRKRERERLRAEMQFHLDALIAENIAGGMSPEEARYAAIRAFGNATVAHEQAQAMWGWTSLERLLKDVRFAMRQIRRAPGFALIAILTLALGIGANAAIFTLTHALLLQQLPIAEPDRLVRLSLRLQDGDPDDDDAPLSLPMIQSIERHARSFTGVFGWCAYDCLPETVDQQSGGLRSALMTGNTFQVLGVTPAAGRLFTAADDQPGGGPDGWAGVISFREWLQRYKADPAAIGQHIKVHDHDVTIVGVAPKGFEGVLVAQRPDIYLPLEFYAAVNNEESVRAGGRLWLATFARLRPELSRGQAAAEMTLLFPVIQDEALPAAFRHAAMVAKARLEVEFGRTGWSVLRHVYTKPFVLLQALVAVVLLICCANLSGLFLARALARKQEFAIRVALGAGRGPLMRQLFVESLLLAVPGGVLGTALAWAIGPWFLHLLNNRQLPMTLPVRPDATVLAVTAACALVCALLPGMAPAWLASHGRPEEAIGGSQTGHSTPSKRDSVTRIAFVPLQLALSLTLVVIATLLSATVMRLRIEDSGYRTKNVMFHFADLHRLPEKGSALIQLYRRVAARMEDSPGVEEASLVEEPPLMWLSNNGKFIAADHAGDSRPAQTNINFVGAHYFSAVGMRLLAGRDLKNEDADDGSCIVNEAAARSFFPHAAALGRMLRQLPHDMGNVHETPHACQVVGIVQDSKYDDLEEGYSPIVFLPISSRAGLTELYFVIHARSHSVAEAAYESGMREILPKAPTSGPIFFTDVFNDSIARQQLLSALSGFFALLGLLLSGIGIYGLVAWNVTQRTREIGVRMALGASRMRVFVLVMRQITVLLAVGVVAGGVAAFFAARSIRGFLFEVQPGNPAIFALAALVLVLIGLLAAALPARRAVSMDPMRALRTE